MAVKPPLGMGAGASLGPGVSGRTIVAMSSYTHTLATGAQVVPVTGVLPGDNIVLTVNQADVNMQTAQAVAGTNQFTAIPNNVPAAGCKVAFIIFR